MWLWETVCTKHVHNEFNIRSFNISIYIFELLNVALSFLYYIYDQNLFYILILYSQYKGAYPGRLSLTTTSGILLPSLAGLSWLSIGWVGGGRQVSCCRDSDVTLQSAFPIFTFTSASWLALSKCWPCLHSQSFN